jgi:holliday junction DNA helicase RuvB
VQDIRFCCPQCTQSLVIDGTRAGESINCPECNNLLTVPAASEISPERSVDPGTIPATPIGGKLADSDYIEGLRARRSELQERLRLGQVDAQDAEARRLASVTVPAGAATTSASNVEQTLPPVIDNRLAFREDALATIGLDTLLTPRTFDDFVGQSRIKSRLTLALDAARKNGNPLRHILLAGPHGSGKSTLASLVVAESASADFAARLKIVKGHSISGSILPSDLAVFLSYLEDGDFIIFDEIHTLKRSLMEYLCRAFKDFTLDIVVDEGPNARPVRLNLAHFTVIATTADVKQVPTSLLACFSIVEVMEPYGAAELLQLCARIRERLRISLDVAALGLVASSSGGSAQGIVNLLNHVKDFATVKGVSGQIDASLVQEALKLLPPDDRTTGRSLRDAIPSEVRREVWRRDEGKCVKCGSRERLEFDHIIPVSKGGGNTARNIELLCEDCNRAKSASIE